MRPAAEPVQAAPAAVTLGSPVGFDHEKWGIYRKAPLHDVDCLPMRPLLEHLWHMAELVGDLPCPPRVQTLPHADVESPEQLELEWARVRQWLRLAASLEFVDVNHFRHEGDA